MLLGACGGDDDASASDRTDAASSTSAEETGAVSMPEDAGTEPDATDLPAAADPATADPSADAALTVTGIRVGAHDGYDRVVFDLGGAGTPGWDVRYVDQAASQGSGDAVDVAGDAVLQVTISGVRYPYETGQVEFSGGPVTGPGTAAITEVVWDATFEGTSVAFVGTPERAPFRVELLADPTRLVVDVAR